MSVSIVPDPVIMSKATRKKLAVALTRRIPVRLARRLIRQQEGAAAVEFALVAIPFLALLFAILQTALVFFAGQVLESATAEASRLILTGQAQTTDFKTGAASPTGYSADDFKNAVCAHIFGLFSCSGIYVNVQTYSSFSGVNTTSTPVTNGQFDSNKLAYNPGGPGCIEAVSVYYQWPIVISLLGDNLSNLGNGSRLLVATSVFRVEPYGASACS